MRLLLLLLLLLAHPSWAQGPPLDPGGGGRPTLPALGPTMPELRGLKVQDARVRLFEARIRDYAVLEVQVSAGVGTVVDQLPGPGAALTPGGYKPRLSVGVPVKPRPRSSPPAPVREKRSGGLGLLSWLLLIAGTAGMVYLGRRLLEQWGPPPSPEAPSIEVIRVTQPPGKKKKRQP